MNNQTQGSRTEMVRQNAQRFPDPTTINAPLTPRQAERAAQFLAMFTPQAAPGVGAGAVPAAAPDVDKAQSQAQEQTASRCRSYEELAAERIERRAKSKAHNRPPKRKPNTWQSYAAPAASEGVQEAEERPAWLLDALESLNEPQAAPAAQPAQKMQRQVQLKPISPLTDLLDLEQFRPKRGRGYGTAGAGALAALLDEYARTALAHRLYLYDEDGNPPRQIVLHLCAELIGLS